MKKIKQLALVALISFGAIACKSTVDIDLGHELDGTWLLTRTCLSGACTEPEEGVEITIRFNDGNLIEQENNQTISASSYTLIEATNDADLTTYSLNVGGNLWILEVKATTMQLTLGQVVRDYSRQ